MLSRELLKILLSLALLLGFPGIPTLLSQSVVTGPMPAPVEEHEERQERVPERTAEKVPERHSGRGGEGENAPGPCLEVGLLRRLLIAGPPRAPLPARDATRLALGLSTTRLRC